MDKAARELGQQVARALVRLDAAVDRGHPWLTAQQIDVPSAALGVLVEAGYAAKRLWAGLPEYRITRQASDFLAELTDRLDCECGSAWWPLSEHDTPPPPTRPAAQLTGEEPRP